MGWNYEDFLKRLEVIKDIGSIDDLVNQVPGLASILNDVDFRIEDLEPIEKILRAMTLEERLNPDLLNGESGIARRQRIAAASETSFDTVSSLIWQFEMLREMLQSRSPEEVTQELMDGMAPREAWQSAPYAWKGNADPAEETDLEEDLEELVRQEAARRDAELAEQVDEVLRKVSSQGMDSLTPEEREVLDEASRYYRSRESRLV